jgi:hypothetical protein
MVFSELRWNYSPLKEKAVLLPDGLFVSLCREQRLAPHRYAFFCFIRKILLLMHAARRVVGLAAFFSVAPLHTAQDLRRTDKRGRSCCSGLAAWSGSPSFSFVSRQPLESVDCV